MNENEPLALEMLKELKRKSEQEENNATRWFRLALFELLAIVVITGAFIWYINQPIEDITYTQDATATDNSNVNQDIGE